MPAFAKTVQQWFKEDTQSSLHHRFNSVWQRHAPVLNQLAMDLGVDGNMADPGLLASLLQQPSALEQPAISAVLADLAVCYLATPEAYARLADPVAMFHLANGARLERINTRADMSAQGIASSYGVMVNYLYNLKDVETNHEAFVSQGKVMLSDALAKKLKPFSRSKD